jgi:hypothetical protein
MQRGTGRGVFERQAFMATERPPQPEQRVCVGAVRDFESRLHTYSQTGNSPKRHAIDAKDSARLSYRSAAPRNLAILTF